MSGITAFGKPVSSGLASQIMGSPSLNQAPSPASPETVPSNEIVLKYATLLKIATDLMEIETDQIRRLTLAEHVQFYDRAIKEAIKSTRSGGAPAPVTLPPMGGPPKVPGMMPGAPPAATGAPTPGAPPSPPPPGAGMPSMPQGVPSA